MLAAQERKADSLLSLLPQQKTHAAKADILHRAARAYGTNHLEKHLQFGYQALSEARLAGDCTLVLNIYRLLSFGNAFEGDRKNAVTYALLACRLADKTANDTMIARAENTLAYQLVMSGKFADARTHFVRGISFAEKNGQSSLLGTLYNNYANLFLREHRFDSTLYYHRKALSIRLPAGELSALGDTYSDMGESFSLQQKTDSAMFYYRKAFALKIQVNDQEMIAIVSLNLTEAFLKQDRLDSAKKYLDNAARSATQIGSDAYRVETYLQYASLFEKQHQPQLALDFLRRYLAGSDSISSADRNKAIERLNQEFNAEKRALEIANLQKSLGAERILHEEQGRRKNIVIAASAAGMVLLLLFAFFIYQRLRESRRQKQIIAEKMSEVELQKKRIEAINSDLNDSITYARRIQEAVLPPKALRESWFPDSFVFYKPKDIVSGDFFWFAGMPGMSFVAAVDCTGHGVPGAFMSMMGNAFLNQVVLEQKESDPGLVLDKLRSLVISMLNHEIPGGDAHQNMQDGMDISFCAFHPESLQLRYAGAYNPIWIFRGEEWIEIKADKQPIGLAPSGLVSFTTRNFQLEKGDMVFLFTDGFADQFGGPLGKKYKYGPLRQFLSTNISLPAAAQEKRLAEEFERWKMDHEQVDDILIIGFRV